MLSSQYHDVFAVDANIIVNTTEVIKEYSRHRDIDSVKRQGHLNLRRVCGKQIQDSVHSRNEGSIHSFLRRGHFD